MREKQTQKLKNGNETGVIKNVRLIAMEDFFGF